MSDFKRVALKYGSKLFIKNDNTGRNKGKTLEFWSNVCLITVFTVKYIPRQKVFLEILWENLIPGVKRYRHTQKKYFSQNCHDNEEYGERCFIDAICGARKRPGQRRAAKQWTSGNCETAPFKY